MLKQVECNFENCDRPPASKGLCDCHYRQSRRSGVLTDIDMSKSRPRGEAQPCGFKDCERPVESAGHCQGHYMQLYRGQQLKPLRNRLSPRKLEPGGAQVLNELGDKRCSQCLEWKNVALFHRNRKTTTGLDYTCKSCRSELYDGNGKSRGRSLRRKYGMSVDAYDSLLESQGGVCCICQNPPRSGKSLAVDHDHGCCPQEKTCGACVRGLLCFPCNTAIGHLEDSLERLNRAARYIENAKFKKEVGHAGAIA